MTVRDLLTKAFKFLTVLGSSESMASDEAADALVSMNGVIEQANITKLLAYYLTNISFTTINGKVSYTIGPAATTPDVTAARPVEILSGYSRRLGMDIPFFVGAKLDYDRIQNKSINVAGWQQMVYYEAGWPKGTIYLYQTPADALSQIFLSVSAEIPVYATLDDTVSLPPVYSTWLQYKTAERLAPENGMPFTPLMAKLLTEVEAALKNNNVKPLPIMASGLGGLASSSGKYNIITDGTRR